MPVSFIAGRLKNYVREWESLTNDPLILSWVKGYKIPFHSHVHQSICPLKRNWSLTEFEIAQKMITELLNKGAISKCEYSKNQFVSDIFLRAKSNGGYRLIINLKNLNKFVYHEHFKLEDWRTASRLISKNCFMCTIDLKDAYYLIPIINSHKKYLRFHFQNSLYEFNCLPFGLNTAPYVFTKILKPLIRYIRNLGIRCVIYLDDFLIIADSYDECKKSVKLVCDLLFKLGFIINLEKSLLIPKTICKYLGFLFDSINMIIELPESKKDKVKKLAKKYLNTKFCKIREFAEFIGFLISCCPAVKYGWAHTKSLEREKYFALEANNKNYDADMTLSNQIRTDLLWWYEKITFAQNSVKLSEYLLEIFTDSSLTGWGAVCNNEKSHGFWNKDERQLPINVLELNAAFFGLKCFANDLKNCNILLRLDNTVAISYVNRMGGIRFKNLNNLAHLIWDWCEQRNIWIFASYIKSKDNFKADKESRRLEPETEFSLNNSTFKIIKNNFGKPDIDLFASRSNKKCELYVSWFRDPNSCAIDAFTLDWSNYFFYAFPPFSMILKVLQKIRDEKATGIVVVPDWPTQPWYPLFNFMIISKPLRFGPNFNLLISSNREPHPLWEKLTLVSAILSGKRSN